MRVYISGEYSGDGFEEIEQHILAARRVAIELWEMGHYAFCPHLNTAHFEVDCDLGYEGYMAGDMAFIDGFEAMVMLPGWTDSAGARREHNYAVEIGMAVYEYPDLPPLHPTEVRSPVQVAAFRQIMGKMMRTHMSKNADYSPLNVAGPGMVGIVTRIWDKVTRLMNLIGFDLKIVYEEDGTIFVTIKPDFKPKAVQHEPLEDTLIDLAVYGVIGKLFLEGKWGR